MHLNTKEKGSMSKEQEREERERGMNKILLIFFFFWILKQGDNAIKTTHNENKNRSHLPNTQC